MELRRYRTASVDEGAIRARADLGPGAMVLSAKTVHRRAWLPWIGGRDVEVTAVAEPRVSAPRHPVAEMETRRRTVSPGGQLAVRLLETAGVDPMVAREIATNLPPKRRRALGVMGLLGELADRLAPLVAPADAFAPIEVFVGPPGGGKTTTLAKVAARARARDRARLSLISADGYRIGAVEQLRIYAEILDAPYTTVTSATELEQALTFHERPILIDTAGRAADDQVLGDLFRSLSRLDDVRTHLVLDAGQTARQIARTIEVYRDAQPDRIVLTKLDQTESLGPLLATLLEAEISVSYLCTGQQVPDDLTPATAHGLAAAVLGEAAAGGMAA